MNGMGGMKMLIPGITSSIRGKNGKHSTSLIGKRFGRWTVVGLGSRPIENPSGYFWWTCKCDCGTVRDVCGATLRAGKSLSCGCLMREICSNRKGDKNARWRGGRKYDDDGYVLIWMPEHPNAYRQYVREHVLVMSQMIGRSLTNDETVHHKNGVKDDNRPMNLELWISSHPAGQRVHDLVSWAMKLLRKYSPDKLDKEYR